MSSRPPKPATVEDYDEGKGKRVSGTKRSARTREESHHKSSSSKPKRATLIEEMTPPPSPTATRPSSSRHHSKVEVIHDKHADRKKSSSEGHKKSSSSSHRPDARERDLQVKTSSRGNEAKYYAAEKKSPEKTTTIPVRPRAATATSTLAPIMTRPPSYQGIPPQNYNPSPSGPSPFQGYSSAQIMPPGAGSYNSLGGPFSPAPALFGYPTMPTPQMEYFPAMPRASDNRYGTVDQSATATIREYTRPQVQSGYELSSGYTPTRDPTMMGRRDSIRQPSRPTLESYKDSDLMPPPRRPTLVSHAATEHSRDPSPGARIEQYQTSTRYHEDKGSRHALNRNSVSYDQGRDSSGVRSETHKKGRRPQSYYGQSASTESGSTGYEEQMREARGYQKEVAGESVPLTAEVLKRVSRQAGSSRSSGSRRSVDESDYRRSQTTRTSSGDDETFTIKVLGEARVTVGGAQVDLNGGEIQIQRNANMRNGSERSTSEFGEPKRIEQRKSRVDERPPNRSRMSSSTRSSDSYARLRPSYAEERHHDTSYYR